MRRALILLAALLVGVGGQRAAGPTGGATVPPDVPAAAPGSAVATAAAPWGAPEITAAGGTSATAFVRTGPGVGPIVWQEGSGPAPRPFTRRSSAPVQRFAAAAAASQATLRTRVAAHRTFGSPLALERAGRSSSSTTTPPPFRSV